MALEPIMSADEVIALLDREFPQIHEGGQSYFIEGIAPGAASLRLHAAARHLRPGGTVSGPAMMTLCDLAAYVVILAHIGPVALAVTTNLNINFLNKPEPGDIVADCRLLKLGKRLAVTECRMHSVASDTIVAHATATYSIPPRDK
ncbi:uncharacterized protein (TIGR00369 family) [Rhodobium orientis]|uniref:Thioesterase n=1 Tax=Rhodobium orientis TaxID=34017 RepID=A0A327JWD2_9HYPH|nr:PaaI family thioesterase [Rhodobium orientis]MBB4304771.1 uncharacterized protein (TIGR00369 family) [Rhodobium orientis]MBK5948054.1 thioesterase [Rhodobium orientis]RAI27488.1 thioesterase [Rhodobium orientis]